MKNLKMPWKQIRWRRESKNDRTDISYIQLRFKSEKYAQVFLAAEIYAGGGARRLRVIRGNIRGDAGAKHGVRAHKELCSA